MEATATYNREDRVKQMEEFEETKAGVKGLVDSGIATIPKFFVHPKSPSPNDKPSDGLKVPVIDLHGRGREELVAAVHAAAEEWGFFQVVNHGIPKAVTDGLLEGVRRFHEQRSEDKAKWYSRDPAKGVMYYSNGYLRTRPDVPVDWRDSLVCLFHNKEVDPNMLPQVCRKEIIDYINGIEGLRKLLSECLSEGLGLSKNFIDNLNCMCSRMLVAHYYPLCPEPDLTLGTSKHSDPYSLTLLLPNNIGGLQVLYKDQWVDVPYLEGAIVANIGDFLQIISNDRFKSVEHRVLARPVGPRISVACFFYPSAGDNNEKVGPIKELLSEENPQVYKEVHHSEYMAHWGSTRVDGRSGLERFKI